jgi:aldehyde:ferredoxin oxidoreductase
MEENIIILKIKSQDFGSPDDFRHTIRRFNEANKPYVEIEEIDTNPNVEICRTRRIAYGFYGCHNCPIACAIQSNNLNVLENLQSALEQLEGED